MNENLNEEDAEEDGLVVQRVLQFYYPPRIPEVELSEELGLSGFSMCEKSTLSNFWTKSKNSVYDIADFIYIEFFAKNETFIEDFRNEDEDQKLDPRGMIQYIHNIIGLFGKVVKACEQEDAYMKLVMTESIADLLPKKLPISHLECLVAMVHTFFAENPHHLPCPTLSASLEKISNLIIEIYSGQNVVL